MNRRSMLAGLFASPLAGQAWAASKPEPDVIGSIGKALQQLDTVYIAECLADGWTLHLLSPGGDIFVGDFRVSELLEAKPMAGLISAEVRLAS